MATNINEPKSVYICGPWYGERTDDRFKEFLILGRIIVASGFLPKFPAFFTAEKFPKIEDYMKETIGVLLKCQYIYLMRGWQENNAAVVEYLTARCMGLQVLCDEGEFPEELDECFPPERRYIISKDYMYGEKTSLDIEVPPHHAEDNEGFQEYYKQYILPILTMDSDTAAADQRTEQTK